MCSIVFRKYKYVCLTSIGIPFIKIGGSHDRLIFIMEMPYPGKPSLYWEGTWASVGMVLPKFFPNILISAPEGLTNIWNTNREVLSILLVTTCKKYASIHLDKLLLSCCQKNIFHRRWLTKSETDTYLTIFKGKSEIILASFSIKTISIVNLKRKTYYIKLIAFSLSKLYYNPLFHRNALWLKT